MIVGDPGSFAIESAITEAFPSLGQRALGYFVIHVGGNSYGARAPDASMLACSFDEVRERLERRGAHQIDYLSHVSASLIVEAFLDAIYRDTGRTDYFGLSQAAFGDDVYAAEVQWAPDGDEAFDDSSYVLQFDLEDRVRLIAFRYMEDAGETAASITEEWIASDDFYGLLSNWSGMFAQEWSDQLRQMNRETGLH
ncbi:hypothetical protein BH10PSE14_BH10PSE14_24680 [soil metagenome]